MNECDLYYAKSSAEKDIDFVAVEPEAFVQWTSMLKQEQSIILVAWGCWEWSPTNAS